MHEAVVTGVTDWFIFSHYFRCNLQHISTLLLPNIRLVIALCCAKPEWEILGFVLRVTTNQLITSLVSTRASVSSAFSTIPWNTYIILRYWSRKQVFLLKHPHGSFVIFRSRNTAGTRQQCRQMPPFRNTSLWLRALLIMSADGNKGQKSQIERSGLLFSFFFWQHRDKT